jgi:hypothetical protein
MGSGMAQFAERHEVDHLRFVVDTVPFRDSKLFRVQSPDVQGLNVLEPTQEEAIDAAKKFAGRIRRSRGQHSDFDIEVIR